MLARTTVPPEWARSFRHYQRFRARQLAVVAAWLAIVIVPLFQLTDLWIDDSTRTLWWPHLGWRSPPVVLAVIILWLNHSRPDGRWPHLFAVLLGVSIMSMMAGLFGLHFLYGTQAMPLMINGLILTTGAVSVLAVFGVRDLLVIYGLPFVALAWLLASVDAGWILSMRSLMHALMMAVIGCVIAEVLFQSRIVAFVEHERLHHNATTDPLTGLLNRRAMESQLQVEHARSSRHQEKYALIMSDLDHFKRVNDTHGHGVGDEVLKELSARMEHSVRLEDAVARWGGEEFLILLRDSTEENAHFVAEKIRKAVAETAFQTSIGRLPITISLGVALYDHDENYAVVIERADEALYVAKANGRNQVAMG
ncbi:GGDEF domain-containing protein [Marinobacteraceae bacterium S3BR75-40.1]